ncbi:organic hydroperoxide resistance protein [Priestia filamentosa]|uniref:Ohr subfamily peroxiredoxin n=1 Tax=Priestia filamentosa TaxID=1402861 RepID=A0A1X7DGV0_9BACI|nr:organic hydroperoxide resistance protein [Priestia filamentosa]AKO93447.1 Ohr subfamily peroxiredoxin [Priestia filamentosa]MDT3763638.1 organic hydroperoxide resistance protein [Priestia filamentosa]OXS71868.1 Ohr subfamily peroxiredoxin [Priestia filamentosa]RJS63249.1 Ohr subfamily peroxiredoxin [Priestia filamentosa]WCM14287.1 organic hydroperoxide resistance protein [Priestia filamentosa]
MEALYVAEATSRGGREGHVTTSDGTLDLNITSPKGLGGKGGDGTNPEQLFAAGYAACFESALQLVLNKERIKAENTEITSHVSIGKDPEDGGFKLEVELVGHVEGVERDKVQELLEKAHGVCPYSKATRGNIEVTVKAK